MPASPAERSDEVERASRSSDAATDSAPVAASAQSFSADQEQRRPPTEAMPGRQVQAVRSSMAPVGVRIAIEQGLGDGKRERWMPALRANWRISANRNRAMAGGGR